MSRFGLAIVMVICVAIGIWFCAVIRAHARDDGRWAQSPLKSWFDSLKSKKGLCCSVSDGRRIDDPNWEHGSREGWYRVRIDGQWWDVGPDEVVTVTNRVGYAMVWPSTTIDERGATVPFIRCFLPGSNG